MTKIYEFKMKPMKEIYYNEDSLYGIYKFNTKDKVPFLEKLPFGDNEVGFGTLTGKMQRLTVGMEYDCRTIELYNKKYNQWQYETLDVKIDRPSTLDDKVTFLKCILTNTQANTLIKVYPDIIERILNNDKIDTSKLKGIGEKTLKTIKEKVIENYILSDIIVMLKPYGISNNVIKKIFEKEKNAVLLKLELKNNPYILTKIKGLGFKKVDSITMKLQPQLRVSEQRMKAYVGYYLSDVGNSIGHSRVTMRELINSVNENIVECRDLFDVFIDKEKQVPTMLHIEGEHTGLLKYYNREVEVLNILHSLDKAPSFPKLKETDIKTSFEEFKIQRGYNLSNEQKSIIYALNENNVVLLTGKAGAGKSSAIDVVLKAFKDRKITLAALSAKAVRRMVEATGIEEAKTIHRLLGFDGKDFKYNEDNPLIEDIFVIDESSMINSSLFLSLLRAIPSGSKVLIVFDDGQLPPIGVGNIATDLMLKDFKHIALNNVFRQALDSGILSDANIIREGLNPISKLKSNIIRGTLKDMYYIFENNNEKIFEKLATHSRDFSHELVATYVII